MELLVLPILLFVLAALLLAAGLLALGGVVGPARTGLVKQMPYESGMDPIHDTRRRFDVRFHLVAIAFLVFDVELLFLYPWAVASKQPQGLRAVEAASGGTFSSSLVFGEILFFVGLLALGWVYAWRKGVFRWR